MASPEELARVVLSLGDIALLGAVAAYLAFVPPVTRARRVLAAYLFFVACWDLTVLQMLWPGYPPPSSSSWVWFYWWNDTHLLMLFAGLAVCWCFPKPPPLRSWHTAVFAAVGAVFLASALLWVFAKPLLYPAWPSTDTFSSGHPVWLVSRYDNSLLLLALVASSLARTRDLPAGEREGQRAMLPMLWPGLFANAGAVLAGVLLAPATAAAVYGIGPACCTWRTPLLLASQVGTLALAGWMAWRWRSYAGVALAVAGVALAALFSRAGLDSFSVNFYLVAFAPAFALGRHGALEAARAPRLARLGLAAVVVGVVLVAVSGAIALTFPDSPLALALGIFAGLALAAAAGHVALPAGTFGPPATLAPAAKAASGTVLLQGGSHVVGSSPAYMASFTVTAPGPGTLTVVVPVRYTVDCDATSSAARFCAARLGLCDTPASEAACGGTYRVVHAQDADNADGSDPVDEATLVRSVSVAAAGARQFFVNGTPSPPAGSSWATARRWPSTRPPGWPWRRLEARGPPAPAPLSGRR